MLKRVLKSVLKKTIGRYLHSEPDLDQLDVQLSKGTFELRNVLFDCDAVNAQLVRGCQTDLATDYICMGSELRTYSASAFSSASHPQ